MEVKRILTKKEQEKKTQRNQILIGIILIGLMVLSTAGYALTSGEKSGSRGNIEKIEYKGIIFIKNSDYWQFEKDGTAFTTRFNAQETEGLKILSYLKLNNYADKALYFVGDNNEAISELAGNLNDKALRIQKACLSEKDCKENFPVKSCDENIIIIKEPQNESDSIYRTNNCVFVVANNTEQVKYSDALLFKILGI